MKTDKKVQLPIEVPYDLVVGGACRDELSGVFPYADLDLYYVDKGKYGKAITMLTDKKYKCIKTVSYEKHNVRIIFSRWKRRGGYKQYDLFLLDTDLKGAIALVGKFPLTCNTCYQKEGGEIIASEKTLADINDRRIELNDNTVRLSLLYGRVKNMMSKDNGWKVGGSIVKRFLDIMEVIYDNPELYYEKENEYVRTRSDGYSTYYRVSPRLIRDFISLLDDNTRVLAFMSTRNEILKAVKNDYNRKLWWKNLWIKLGLRKANECS